MYGITAVHIDTNLLRWTEPVLFSCNANHFEIEWTTRSLFCLCSHRFSAKIIYHIDCWVSIYLNKWKTSILYFIFKSIHITNDVGHSNENMQIIHFLQCKQNPLNAGCFLFFCFTLSYTLHSEYSEIESRKFEIW